MYSRTTLLSSHATGFRSLAKASAPIRSASSGIAPPPANGSTTRGLSPTAPPNASCAARVKPRLVSRYSEVFALSTFEKSAIKSSRAKRRTFQCASLVESRPPDFERLCHFVQLSCEQCAASSLLVTASCANLLTSREASSRKVWGQCGSAGSGHSAAQTTARQAAGGRVAGQI